MDVLGTVTGVAALVLAFQSVVESYLLFESYIAHGYTKAGLKDLALQYHIQCQIFENWGDHYNLRADNPEDCTLHKESEHTKKLLLEIIRRIAQLHQEARHYLEIHHGNLIFPENVATLSVQQAFIVAQDHEEPAGDGKLQEKRSHKRRFQWAIKNKDSFAEVVHNLRTYNEDLANLVEAETRSSLAITLPGRILASIDGREDLEALVQRTDSSVSHAANLKALEVSLRHGIAAKSQLIPATDLVFLPTSGPESGSRVFGIYDKSRPVWVEWANFEGLPEVEASEMLDRTRTLSRVLSKASMDILRTAECIGLTEDNLFSHRQGLVFNAPAGYPTALSQIIQGSSSKVSGFMPEPPLGHKFELARRLASSLALLHATKWLHKAFRSDNIIFFGFTVDVNSLLDPLVAGFENSREVGMVSRGRRPDGSGPMDYFYHPSVMDGFDRRMDLYSFGVVLLEIAYWRPLREKIAKSKPKPESLDAIRDLFVKSAEEKLPTMMGSIYANVVKLCLDGKLWTSSDKEFTCSMSVHVISKLAQCRA